VCLLHSESSCFVAQNSHCCVMCSVIRVWGVYLSWKCWSNMPRWFQIWCNVNLFSKNVKLLFVPHWGGHCMLYCGFPFFCLFVCLVCRKFDKNAKCPFLSIYFCYMKWPCAITDFIHILFLRLLSSVMVLTCGYQWGGSTYGVGWGLVHHGTVLSIVKKFQFWQDESFKLCIDV